jgi:antitoxin MazE
MLKHFGFMCILVYTLERCYMAAKLAFLTIQRWGNSLAVRIPAALARSAHFEVGTPVEVALQEGGIAVRSSGERKLTLDERLALFDYKKHGGEIMPSETIGLEKLE